MNNMTSNTSIADLNAGEHGLLTELQIGRAELSRCSSLGLTPGVEITMLQNPGHGPLIIRVRGTQIALGRGQASKLYVDKEEL